MRGILHERGAAVPHKHTLGRLVFIKPNDPRRVDRCRVLNRSRANLGLMEAAEAAASINIIYARQTTKQLNASVA